MELRKQRSRYFFITRSCLICKSLDGWLKTPLKNLCLSSTHPGKKGSVAGVFDFSYFFNVWRQIKNIPSPFYLIDLSTAKCFVWKLGAFLSKFWLARTWMLYKLVSIYMVREVNLFFKNTEFDLCCWSV